MFIISRIPVIFLITLIRGKDKVFTNYLIIPTKLNPRKIIKFRKKGRKEENIVISFLAVLLASLWEDENDKHL